MKRETFLTTAVIALLLLNIGILSILFIRRPPPDNRHALDQQIVEMLALNTVQQKQFEQLKSDHHQKMIASEHDYRLAMQNYFGLLENDSIVPEQRDSLLQLLLQSQRDRITVTFEHFQALKNMCSPEQKVKFPELLPDLMTVILPKSPPPAPGGKPL